MHSFCQDSDEFVDVSSDNTSYLFADPADDRFIFPQVVMSHRSLLLKYSSGSIVLRTGAATWSMPHRG